MSSLSAAAAGCTAFNSGTVPVSRVYCANARGCMIAKLAAKTNERANTQSLRIVSSSGVNSALPDRVGHAINGQHVSRDAVVYLMRVSIAHHISERRNHDLFQLLVHHRLFPEVPLPVLHPLEVRSRNTTGIRQNVGNHKNSLVG